MDFVNDCERLGRNNDLLKVAILINNSLIKMSCHKLHFPFVGKCGENNASLSYKSHRRRNLGRCYPMNVNKGCVLTLCTIVFLALVMTVTAEYSVRSVGTWMYLSCKYFKMLPKIVTGWLNIYENSVPTREAVMIVFV